MANFTTNDIVTGNFRISYPSLFTPRYRVAHTVAVPNPPKGFQATMIFDANDPAVLEIRKLLKAAIVGQWSEDKAKWPATLRAINMKTYASLTGKDGWPIRDGSTVSSGPGTVSIKASSTEAYPPMVVDQRKQELLTEDSIRPGMICRAVVCAWAYDRADSKGVSLTLKVVQLVKDDGVRFGGADNSQAAAMLGTVEDGSDNPNNYPDDL